MPEWWSYTLSDIQSFSLHSYHRLFELYNRAIWPAPIATLVLGLAVLVLVRRRPVWGGIVAAILAACWLGIAIVFFAHRYATLTWTAKYFAWGFGLEAALLPVAARRLKFETRPAALAIFVFALTLQPLIGLFAGRTWRQVEIFGIAPDPTAVATLGILLMAAGRVRWELMAVPLLWLAISAATLSSMDAPDTAVPIVAAALVVVQAAWQTFARRRKKSRKEVP